MIDVATISVFIAGIIMFLAPCTLPLVPAYLAFISGVSGDGGALSRHDRIRIMKNGIAFVLGFSVVFIISGVLLGLFGSYVAPYRAILLQLSGILIILFGLMMLGVIRVSFLERQHAFRISTLYTPGKQASAALVGASFAFGWTPCVGPILASVLLLAGTAGTVAEGTYLLTVFSLGLALPFLLTAFLYGHAARFVGRVSWVSRIISLVGGAFLVLLGVLILTDNFGLTITYGYEWFDFLHYDALLDYL